MNPVDQSGRRSFRPIGGRGWLLGAAALLTLAGCETLFGTRAKNDPDPLLGFHDKPKAVAGAANEPSTSGPVPALPTSYAAQGPAPLAAGESPTGTDPRHLAITDTARAAAPNVAVGAPEPATTDSTSNRVHATGIQQMGGAAPSAAVSSGSASTITTIEQAQQFLQKHGVNWQRSDMTDGHWKFQCAIPNPSTPNVDQHFESSGSFPDQLSAMRAVIAEIEKTGK